MGVTRREGCELRGWRATVTSPDVRVVQERISRSLDPFFLLFSRHLDACSNVEVFENEASLMRAAERPLKREASGCQILSRFGTLSDIENKPENNEKWLYIYLEEQIDNPISPSDPLVSKYSIQYSFRPTIFGKIDLEGTNRINGEAALIQTNCI